MDHAGIATQVVVERELRKEGIDRRELGREAFIERVWAWKERYGGEIVDQIKRMGASLDWERERFTMDEGLVARRPRRVRALYEDGLIYRGERLVNWCPTRPTGLSDSEVEHEDVDGRARHVPLPAHRRERASTSPRRASRRCSATPGIAVHPDDERYAAWSGRRSRIPFDGREHPDRRRRGRRSGVRHRRGEGHARARPERLRDRAAAPGCRC